jgi:hypothetical protein
MEIIVTQLSFEIIQENKKPHLDWSTIADLISAFFTSVLTIFAIFSYYQQDTFIPPLDIYLDTTSSTPENEIPPIAKKISNIYRSHWQNHNVSPLPCYCQLNIVNHSNFHITNVIVKITLAVDDNTPLKKDFVSGNTASWIQTIPVINPGSNLNLTIIDVSPFYTGTIIWEISIDHPQKSQQRKTIKHDIFKINNSSKLKHED